MTHQSFSEILHSSLTSQIIIHILYQICLIVIVIKSTLCCLTFSMFGTFTMKQIITKDLTVENINLRYTSNYPESFPVCKSVKAFCRLSIAVGTSSYCKALEAYLQYF